MSKRPSAPKRADRSGAVEPTEIDFSDLEHGVGVLEECMQDTLRRNTISEMLIASVERLEVTAADDFRNAVAECASFGGSIEKVRAAFTQMVIGSAGWSASQAIKSKEKLISAQHGRQGGRPVNTDVNEWYLREHDKLKVKNPLLSLKAIGDRLAQSPGIDGSTRASRTIQTAIKKAQKVRR